ncbi:hypothetical protein NE237_010604 [Protea cynaroides]|uniref:Uncharacterized protein n=1 Tax=Protea cynaroides TaxID=273540 RepID=A0A9Q0L0P5_9MAGN|nr:hypothetical protein NE237_010604 [Protea cynaroides]
MVEVLARAVTHPRDRQAYSQMGFVNTFHRRIKHVAEELVFLTNTKDHIAQLSNDLADANGMVKEQEVLKLAGRVEKLERKVLDLKEDVTKAMHTTSDALGSLEKVDH